MRGIVTFGATTAVGIDFINSNTFVITRAGLYALVCSLNFAVGTPANTYFWVLLNNNPTEGVAPVSNADTVGEITISRVNFYNVGDIVQIASGNIGTSTTLEESPGVTGSAGHLIFFRFADGAQ
ncbi:hypothetical protein K413DRAFT_2367 [Clostridium sp. ASBs410]|jgi:hypothetical protein|nr:hypothetical protein K413DRAFT_2367 [Clostridium sp. ASBs410]